MSDNDEPTGRDIRVMWRTVTVVAVIVAATVGAIISAVVWEVKQDGRIEGVEKWQAQREKEAARELWRRERERWAQPGAKQ